MKELEQLLRAKDIRPSFLRMKILEYFFLYHNHPSVNMIYDELHDLIPTLSKTSVYNTLSLFVEHNIIETLGITDNEQRYDLYRGTTHAHFLCKNCQKIWDSTLDIDVDEELDKYFPDFAIETKTLQFTGICQDCMEKKEIGK